MAREVVYLNLNWFVDECRDDFMKFSLVVDSSLNVCNSYAEQGRVKGFFYTTFKWNASTSRALSTEQLKLRNCVNDSKAIDGSFATLNEFR